ncbi:hypothetical protein Afil01_66740 [Actinorhabdospora filicis]|uniref:Uncharacterized protein n=1 Tax=Actinorhabdospora filicis TaxID=1785913 RepID=A0A9W6ST57_9ACTN|nr:hypothetical protein [Actinorhabdospora filicis]GLZ81867.1 hypothetical protein Afil01_66740 [Actinorhabdospora filicis]
MELVFVGLFFVLLAVAGALFGHDSREPGDWRRPIERRVSPVPPAREVSPSRATTAAPSLTLRQS